MRVAGKPQGWYSAGPKVPVDYSYTKIGDDTQTGDK
jgi:hypothetical protein